MGDIVMRPAQDQRFGSSDTPEGSGMQLRRPVIGIPTQTLQAIEGIPPSLPASWVMNQRYFLAVTAAGAVPWMIPLLHDDPATLREIYDRLDAIVLPGGVDLDPGTYGEAAHPRCGQTDPARDQVELQLARWAIEDGKPLLGLCRGIQVINVALGGTLWQDIETQLPQALKHDYWPSAGFGRDYLAHPVELAADSRLRELLQRDSLQVNSMHHQAIRRLSPQLVATAVAPDGVVEGIEGRAADRFLVGVQWHPEVFEERDASTRRLFRALIAATNGYGAASR
jgi:putative glutamine amidotransferase